MVTAVSNRCGLWFGTKDYAQFIRTPQTGADVSPQAWGSSGTLLNGSGYVFNSFNSHKEYSFSWGATAAREAAQTMKSYFDGSFGRGKLHFVDPLTYSTNVLPARWADPSITADFEGPQLVPGVDPYTVPTSNFQWLRLPVRTAVFDLGTVQPVANTVFLPEAENLFTNPNLVGTGTYATVAENLFTNPRLKGDGTWAEVRRNLCPNPYSVSGGTQTGSPNGTNPEITRSVALPIPTPDGRMTGLRGSTPSGSSPSYRVFSAYNLDGLSNTSGVERSVGAWFMVDAPGYSAYFTGSAPVALEPNEWKWVTTDTPRAGDVFTTAYIEKTDGSEGDFDNGYVTGVTAVAGTIPPEAPFDGSTTPATAVGVDQPEDFRWRWLGEPNVSESVMEIEQVRGLNAINCVAGVSTKVGKPAVRMISTGESPYTRAHFSIPVEARSSGTLIGTVHQDAPISPPLAIPGERVANLMVLDPEQRPVGDFNEAGSRARRLSFSDLTGAYQASIYHGGALGSLDVWWTDIGLFAGDYPYETFNGESDPPETGIEQPEDFRIRWTGAVDNSTSVMEIETVAGVSTFRSIAGVSSDRGRPAVRLIVTEEGGSAYFSFSIPTGPVRSGGSLIGTRNRSGSFNSYALRADSPVQSTPPISSPGVVPERLYFGERTSTYRVYLYAGTPNVGDGDTWWTDIGLFAGNYTGPWFSGDTEIPGKVIRWTGAPNNSTSQIGVLQPVSTPNVNEENSVFVPIPDGMQLNVGAFYSGSPEAGVYVVNATQGGSPGMNITRLQPLTPSDTNILPNVFTKAPGDIGVYIVFGKLESVDALLNITAIHARLSLIGVSPQGENYWLGGQGNEGVRFVQPPTYINHTGVNGGQVEFAATFKESIH